MNAFTETTESMTGGELLLYVLSEPVFWGLITVPSICLVVGGLVGYFVGSLGAMFLGDL